ncbi:hypothetical protein RB653_009417 [Dictyostelium firmibasis]|uniref:CBS domain-containing protein n=1 Tax=Dictyostelium firmibasis TaxID=79012 RepID=A0AAN7U205_9MYCE
MLKSGLINLILKNTIKNNIIPKYPNIIPQLSLDIFKVQNIYYSSSNKWNENMLNISPNSIEIIKIKNQVIGENLHTKLKSYKDTQVGNIIENKIKKNLGRMVKVGENETVYNAIKVMNDKKVGATIVVDRNNRMCGIFSERDYLTKVDLRGLSPKETLVKEVCTKHLITVSSDSGATKCLSIMSKRNIRHLPVVENKRLIGMLSIGDIVKYIISSQNTEINELKSDIDKE